MRQFLLSFLIFCASVLFLSFNNKNEVFSGGDAEVYGPPYASYSSQWAKNNALKLTLAQKIGQMIMLPAYPTDDSLAWRNLGDVIESNAIGGIIVFKGTPYRTAKMINYLQSRAKIPLMVAMDAEWGVGMRMDSVLNFPHQMQLGAIRNNSEVYEFGVEVAKQCKRMGIQINFAPSVDVNNNPKNPVINSRSFGENPDNVAEKGFSYMKAMQDNKVLAVAKHFPGHGNTFADSHKMLPIVSQNLQELDSAELYPFNYLIKRNLGGVMIAHLDIPALDSTKNSVSSLSRPIVSALLKQQMNFQGIIFTDALDMRGVTNNNAEGELDVKALAAGNDVLLMPQNAEVAIHSILRAVEAKDLKLSAIDASVNKIMNLKYWLGLNNYRPADLANITNDINSENAFFVKRKLIENSLTLVQDSGNVIPFKNLNRVKIASVEFGNEQGTGFIERMNDYLPVSNFKISNQLTAQQIKDIDKDLNGFDYVIVSTHNTNQYSENYGISDNVWTAINALCKSHKLILVNFANPYSLSNIKNKNDFAAIIEAYDDDAMVQDYAAQLLFGGIKAQGKLPVSAGDFKEGSGLIREKNRLKYSVAEDVDVKDIYFQNIDSIINDAIDKHVFPGCQILAIKDGVVFFDKNYGYQTYDKKVPITSETIYDLASLTKVLSTLPSLMYLYDRNELNINKQLKDYLPETDTTNKGDLVIKSILTHQARLQSWIPFYLSSFYPYSRKLRTDLYTNKPDSLHSLQVAANLYILNSYTDSIYSRILDSKLRNHTGYAYSDLGFYLFKEIIENNSKTTLDKFVDSVFYSRLGAKELTYKPLNKFSADIISPTEDDINFRKQLLQGYVHDYGAAMLGGVGGHAGLFGNANDVGKMMQMYLNGGWYGDQQLIKQSTLDLFNTRPYKNNRRVLGFDKPPLKGTRGSMGSLASEESYGHTGFTGTLVWVDPKYNFVYVFLSNRIYPDIENEKINSMGIRGKVHNEFYKAIINGQKNKAL